MGKVEGSIMAIIMASHIAMNIVAASKALPMGIHIMLMVQLPGMSIPLDIA
ncbi:MAG: hypothetical protein NVS1B11_17690 [Terriglobales bacterium]